MSHGCGWALPVSCKRVGVFGLGRSNLALLPRLSDREIVLRSEGVIDRRAIPSGTRIAAIYEGARAFLDPCEELLILSPSVRRERRELREFLTRGTVFTSDAEIFFSSVGAPVYAVTGSDGKSTTATLAHRLAALGRSDAALCGNVGIPFCTALSERRSAFVTELSSFTLRYIAPRTERAVITNITPNHLNWHDSYDEYIEAKIAVFRNTGGGVINFDDGIIRERAAIAPSAVFSCERGALEIRARFPEADVFTVCDGYFEKNGERLFPVSAMRRGEAHNVKNMLAALALTDGLWSCDGARAVAEGFGGLAHRCEEVGVIGNVRYINSSIDTTPTRTAATLESLGAPAVVILGGRDKGLDFSVLLPSLSRWGRAAVLIGECAGRIAAVLPEGMVRRFASDMEEAVASARALARPGDTVLLSPAATSYDAYADFEARGEDFKETVKKLR